MVSYDYVMQWVHFPINVAIWLYWASIGWSRGSKWHLYCCCYAQCFVMTTINLVLQQIFNFALGGKLRGFRDDDGNT